VPPVKVVAPNPAADEPVEPVETLQEAVAVETAPSAPVEIVKPKTHPLPDFDDVAAMTAENFETLVRINSVFAHGLERISEEVISQSMASWESAAAASTAFIGARSLKDVVELSQSFARSHYEKMMDGTTRLGELTAKVATDTFSPITERASRLIESMTRPVS
jgi:hypothetical protein